MHAYVPPIVVVAQKLESSTVLAEVVGGATGAVDTIATVDVAVDIDASSKAADILAEIDHGLARCLSLHTYHILLWV